MSLVQVLFDVSLVPWRGIAGVGNGLLTDLRRVDRALSLLFVAIVANLLEGLRRRRGCFPVFAHDYVLLIVNLDVVGRRHSR